jgi:hypothetical protein
VTDARSEQVTRVHVRVMLFLFGHQRITRF